MSLPDIEPAGVPERSGPGGLVRLRLDVAYDGTGFCGWARQPGLRSVQAELEAALRAVLRIPGEVPVRVSVAGRTDAGVHATGQACHADVPIGSLLGSGLHAVGSRIGPSDGPIRLPTEAPDVRRRLNGLLPPDIRVQRVAAAPEGFDARWSATWRHYAYLVADDPRAQDPRNRGHVLWHPRPLDAHAMRAAAAPFLGEHDFAAFCRAREGASTTRTVLAIDWQRLGGAPGSGPVEFSVRADAFCHSMVRALVGAFLAVGDRRWPVERPAELLAGRVRVPAIPTAPAHGLTLVAVGYPEPEGLAAQAIRSKRWRGA